jgi:hypothetical protein
VKFNFSLTVALLCIFHFYHIIALRITACSVVVQFCILSHDVFVIVWGYYMLVWPANIEPGRAGTDCYRAGPGRADDTAYENGPGWAGL